MEQIDVTPSQPPISFMLQSNTVGKRTLRPLTTRDNAVQPAIIPDEKRQSDKLKKTPSKEFIFCTIGNILLFLATVITCVVTSLMLTRASPDSVECVECAETEDLCQSSSCYNYGTCYGNSTHFNCVCSLGYSGDMCEEDINECENSPCENGGTCTNEIAQFSCTCRPGFIGGLCQFGIDPCTSSPCSDGDCFSNDTDYLCSCPSVESCVGDIVMILDVSGSMSSYVNQNKDLMNAVAQNFPIGFHSTLVSLLFVYSAPSLMWGFNSYHTNSTDNLQYGFNNFPTDQASGSYLSLGAGLDFARTSILPTGRIGAADIVIMFWDGDTDLSTAAGNLHLKCDVSVVSVAPRVQTGTREANVQSIVTSLDDMFYLSDASLEETFIERLNQKLNCCM